MEDSDKVTTIFSVVLVAIIFVAVLLFTKDLNT
jgi:hypothetical protein